jgi:magnesium transporter
MRKFSRKTRKSGLPPGTVLYTGREKSEKASIHLMDYTAGKLLEKDVKSVDGCFEFRDEPSTTWINITGIHDTEMIERIGKHFGLHPIILEDIASVDQRPKMEDLGDYIYIVLNMLSYDERKKEVKSEQVSIILGRRFVISFLEDPGDVFENIRERIRNEKGKIRKLGNDYLAYSLIDAIVDNYFIILELLGNSIDELETHILENPNSNVMYKVQQMKRELIYIRKSVWPLRELISNIERSDSKLINPPTKIYYRDLYDHTVEVMEAVETFRDLASGMIDIYLSSLNNRMNEIMKVLTIISTIFIPLSFIASLYGMNFHYMPELSWKYGYVMVWVIILFAAGTMLMFFKRRKWI